MKVRKSSIVLAVIGVLLLVYGAVQLPKSKSADYSWLETVKGETKVVEGAVDPDFHVEVDGPVLMRKVEMYQLTTDKDKTGLSQYKGIWSTKHEADIKIDAEEFRKLKARKGLDQDLFKTDHIANPKFPDGLKSQTFVGKVSIGDDGIFLSDDLVEKFSYDSYTYLKQQPQSSDVTIDTEEENAYEYKLYDGTTYGSSPWVVQAGMAEVGDIRVTWTTVVPEEINGRVFTAAGKIEDNVVGVKSQANWIYDTDKDAAELQEQYKGNKIGMAKASMGFGIFLILLAVFLTVKGSAKGRKEE